MPPSAARLVPHLCRLLVAGIVLAFAWFVWSTYSNVYNSDGFAIPHRMMDYATGEIGLVQLIFMKHVEHFHSLVFLLGFIDWTAFNGTMMLPRLAGALSAVLYAGILLAVARSDVRLSDNQRWTVAVAVCAMALSATGWVIWTVSFQSVVSTFWILYAGAIYASCRSAASRTHARRWLAAAFALAAVALFAHGSGFLAILVPPLPLLLAGRRRDALLYVVGLALIYAAGNAVSALYPSREMLSVGALAVTLLLNLPGFLWTIFLFLGSSLFHDARLAPFAGIGCALWVAATFVVAARTLRRGEAVPSVDAFSLCLILGGGLSAGLATALRFSLMIENDDAFDPAAYMESRYFLASGSVWIGLVLFWPSRLGRPLRIAVPAVLGATFFVSGWITALPASRVHTAYLEMGEAAVGSRHYETSLVGWLFPDRVAAVRWLEFAASEGKGPFSAHATIGTSAETVPITSRTPVEFVRPDGSLAPGCRLSGPIADTGRAVRLVDNEGRIVAIARPSAYESNLTEQNLDVADYLARYRDVADAVDAGHIRPWQHYQHAIATGEGRIARSLDPGWLAFANTCDVAALR